MIERILRQDCLLKTVTGSNVEGHIDRETKKEVHEENSEKYKEEKL